MIEILERALSIRQPFVEQILEKQKTMEYRSRRTNIRERVYLYAGKSIVHLTIEEHWEMNLPRGFIVGSVEIMGCVPVAEHSGGGFAWLLTEPTRYAKPWKPLGMPMPGFWRPKSPI
jgi:hypothetical protein